MRRSSSRLVEETSFREHTKNVEYGKVLARRLSLMSVNRRFESWLWWKFEWNEMRRKRSTLRAFGGRSTKFLYFISPIASIALNEREIVIPFTRPRRERNERWRQIPKQNIELILDIFFVPDFYFRRLANFLEILKAWKLLSSEDFSKIISRCKQRIFFLTKSSTNAAVDLRSILSQLRKNVSRRMFEISSSVGAALKK